MGIDILEHGGMCRLLVFYLDSPNGLIRANYRDPPLRLGPRAAERDHHLLFENGLIENSNHPTQLRFQLTDKGKQVAIYLKEIEKILQKKN